MFSFLISLLQLWFCLSLTVTSWPSPQLSPGASRIWTHGADVSPLIPHQHWDGGAISPPVCDRHWAGALDTGASGVDGGAFLELEHGK